MEIYNLHLVSQWVNQNTVFAKNMNTRQLFGFQRLETVNKGRKKVAPVEFGRKDTSEGHTFRRMSCCPESSWPSLGAAGYQPKGKIEKVNFGILSMGKK